MSQLIRHCLLGLIISILAACGGGGGGGDGNDTPSITSEAAPSVAENTTVVTTVTASSAAGHTLTFTITGGADAALFVIDTLTGELAFITAPDFESPADADENNVYDVQVTVDYGNGSAVIQNMAVTVTWVNNLPSFTSGSAPSVAENTTAVTTITAADADGDSPTFSITGGADATLFTIVNITGVLTFNAAPDFELPADDGANNVYNLQVTADDGNGGTAIQNMAVTVTWVNNLPSITSGTAPSVAENTTAVTTITAADADGDSPAFSITGGADAALFTIVNITGVLTFNTAPDFELPADDGANNVYNLQVTADDGNGGTAVQNMAVTVSDYPPPGIYGGTITATGGLAQNASALITSNGKLALIDLVTFEAINGTISDSLITGRVLAPPSSAALTGTITSAVGNNITGTYSSPLGSGTFNLDGNNSLYLRGANFTKLSGTWVDSVYTGGTGITTWVFQNDGSYAMTSTASCDGSGQFSLIDTTNNEYEMDLVLSNCGTINGTYTGIATMSETSNPDDTLTFMFINGAGTVGGLFEPIRQ